MKLKVNEQTVEIGEFTRVCLVATLRSLAEDEVSNAEYNNDPGHRKNAEEMNNLADALS